MKPLRWGVAIGALFMMGGGYVASIVASMSGRATDHAIRMDQPQIRLLALVLLAAAIGLAFVPDRAEKP